MTLARKEMIRTGFKRAEPKPSKGPKLKKCRVCKEPYEPRSPMQKACSTTCAIADGKRVTALQKAKAQRIERAQDKAKRDSLKSRSDWVKEAQRSFNRFINKRDSGLPCCACGLPINGTVHASHFLSVGAHPNLRFNENNCHSGCVKCNVFLHGNLLRYRENLIKKIGIAEVEALESDNAVLKLTAEDLAGIKRKYDLQYKLINDQDSDKGV